MPAAVQGRNHRPAPLYLDPEDPADRALLDRVGPSSRRPPTPAALYDLVVIGGGTAGLVAAMGAAGLGARVALIERHLLGGDCLNTGCVPSKALLRSARAVGEWRRGAGLGVRADEPVVDFAHLMRRMRERRAALATHDSARRLAAAGVHVFFGAGRFEDGRTVVVGDLRLRFVRAVIATGGRPSVPGIPGLDSVPYLTNETVFSLTELPARLVVVGAGPIGCELAQAFTRFGSHVTLVDVSSRVLPRDDEDAAAILQRCLEREGVALTMGADVVGVEQTAGPGARLHVRQGANGPAHGFEVEADTVLLATGRAPNVEELGLDRAGIRFDSRGVTVDDRLRTSNPRVYASGDVASDFKFTHAADALSRVVLQNALFFGRRRASRLVIPWTTYTDPEVAHVGVATADVARSSGRLQTITVPLAEVDRAVVDDEVDGFVRVHHEHGLIRGGTIVAPHAGELMGELAYAMTHGGTLSSLSAVVHPYPTLAGALGQAGDAYRRSRLTPPLRRWLERYFSWTRR